MSVVIPLPVAQLTPQTSADSTSSSASSAAGSFCGSPASATAAATATAGCEAAAESLSLSSSDGGFYEMTAEDIDTAGREAEDFMQFQVRNKEGRRKVGVVRKACLKHSWGA